MLAVARLDLNGHRLRPILCLVSNGHLLDLLVVNLLERSAEELVESALNGFLDVRLMILLINLLNEVQLSVVRMFLANKRVG